MKIAIYGKTFEQDFSPGIKNLFRKLEKNNAEVLIYGPFYDFIREKAKITPDIIGTFTGFGDLPAGLNYFFSVGGDGTFLETVTFVRDTNTPIVGINSGRLGFLANISREELPESMDAIFRKNYSLEERTLLKFETSEGLFGDFACALNEVTIQKIGSTMITIQTYVDDELLNSYWADGLILSTPTGSTAYSLSVGGPIIIPDSNTFIISPIAPHNLTVRPVVIPDHVELRLKVNGRTPKFLATVDSRSAEMKNPVEIILKKADFRIQILKLDNHNYYSTLRSKLMWGADKRN